MGEKKKKDEKEEQSKKKKGDDKSNGGTTVVLKMDMHCEGCADKIVRFVKSIDGVEKAKADWESNKLTVRGEVAGADLREKLQEKMKKKVELVSQSPKKKDDNKANGSSDDSNPNEKKPQAQDKKPKDKEVLL